MTSTLRTRIIPVLALSCSLLGFAPAAYSQQGFTFNIGPSKGEVVGASVGAAAVAMAKSVGSKAIVVFTYSGRSALSVARHRPNIPVIAFTRSEEVARHLVLSRNVIPFVADEFHTIVEIGEYATKFVKREGIVQPGESFVLTASHPLLHTHLPNNFVKIVEVE